MSISEKLQTIAENEQRVYEAGKQAEYDAFWDIAQNNGDNAGVNYYYKFAYDGMWNDENFNPKYDLICSNTTTGAQQLFRSNSQITDTKVPIRVLGSSTNGMFYNCANLITIRKLIVHSGVEFNTTFFLCNNLKTLIVEGTIGKNGFDVQYSQKLSHDSIVSIINALSSTTSGLSVTLSKTAVNKAFETSTSAADGSTSPEWLALIATKTNWTISLV